METIEIIGEALLGTFCQMGELGSYVALTLIILAGCLMARYVVLKAAKGITSLFGGL